MRTKPIFTSLDGASLAQVSIDLDGRALKVPQGLTVAAALILAGAEYFRESPVSNSKRAPYCMMGVCFECLVEIDGQPSLQSCLVEVRDGMRIRRQHGAATVSNEKVEVPA